MGARRRVSRGRRDGKGDDVAGGWRWLDGEPCQAFGFGRQGAIVAEDDVGRVATFQGHGGHVFQRGGAIADVAVPETVSDPFEASAGDGALEAVAEGVADALEVFHARADRAGGSDVWGEPSHEGVAQRHNPAGGGLGFVGFDDEQALGEADVLPIEAGDFGDAKAGERGDGERGQEVAVGSGEDSGEVRGGVDSVWPETSALGGGAGQWGRAGSAARRFWPGTTPKQAKSSGAADTAPGGRVGGGGRGGAQAARRRGWACARARASNSRPITCRL